MNKIFSYFDHPNLWAFPCEFLQQLATSIFSYSKHGITDILFGKLDVPSSAPGRIHLPLILDFHFFKSYETYVKHVDFSTFRHFGNLNALTTEFEQDGFKLLLLWDSREDMAICHGDWDSRVYPGMKIDVFFESFGEECSSDYDESDNDSDEEDSVFQTWRTRDSERETYEKCMDMTQRWLISERRGKKGNIEDASDCAEPNLLTVVTAAAAWGMVLLMVIVASCLG